LGQSPETIVLDRGEHGKPRLASSKGPVRPEFNLAHAGDLALLALAGPDCSIGVDLERVRDLKNIRKVAASVFTPAECELVFAASPGDPRPAFYRAWTRKEAISKGIGKGLQLRFDQWEVLAPETPCERPPILFRHPASDQEWAIWDLRLSDDYLAALAMVRTPQRVRFYDGGPLR
jgi:4'-phosphopantetheinyl transferase